MVRFIPLFLTFAIIGIVINTITIKTIKDNSNELIKNLKENHIIIHYPNVYKWIGLIGSMFFMLLFVYNVIFPEEPDEMWVKILLGIFIL